MEIVVENVRITLTPEQVDEIKKEQGRRARCRNSFVKMLKHFGFKKGNEYEHNYYEQKEHGWYADFHCYGNWTACFMGGKGLTHDSAPPGGHEYGTPKEIEDELLRALAEINS